MLNFSIRGLDEMRRFLAEMPAGIKKQAENALADYFIGDQTHGLMHYPVYKHITREAAYGTPFVSDAQRRYVMAAIREGRITPGYPQRTGELQRGWKKVDQGPYISLVNPTPYAGYVMGLQDQQARLNALVGWRQWPQVIKDNLAGALRHAKHVVKKWIDSRRPGRA